MMEAFASPVLRKYNSKQTLDEIRSHHLFEHFDRAHALALLIRWHGWLRPGGALTVDLGGRWRGRDRMVGTPATAPSDRPSIPGLGPSGLFVP